MCRNGTCEDPICQIRDEEFVSAEQTYKERNESVESVDGKLDGESVVGKLVKITQHGFVYFKDPDGDEPELDLNWKRLRNMAWPIVNHQLAKIANDGKWKTQPVRVDLGTLMLDNSVIRFDPGSYIEMEKDNTKDLKSCETAWLKKLRSELKKRGIETDDDGTYAKRRHWGAYLGDYGLAAKEKENRINDSEEKEKKKGGNRRRDVGKGERGGSCGGQGR